MAIIFIRAIILYILVIFSVRLMGKRQIGELQPTELVITILVSNIATLPLEDLETPLVMGIIPILSLVCFDVIMSWLTLKSKKIRKIVSGTAKIIIHDGVIDQQVLKDLRFSVDDLMTALRGNNVFDISEVQFAIVETNGNISIYQKFQNRPVTHEDMKINGVSENPPNVIISDGILYENELQSLGKTKNWLNKILNDNNISINDVFLMTATKDGNYNLIERDKKNDKS